MLVDARHAASALAFPPGAGPGLAAPPVAAPAVGAIQAEAGDQVWVRIETDGDKHRGEVVTLTGGEIIHGNVGLKMEGTTHFAIRRMLRADIEAAGKKLLLMRDSLEAVFKALCLSLIHI